MSHLHQKCRRKPTGLTGRVRPAGGSPYALALTVVRLPVECEVVPEQVGRKGEIRAEVSSSSALASGRKRLSISGSDSWRTVGLPGGTHVPGWMDLCMW